MSSLEPTAEALARMFLDPDAPLGAAWLQSASIPMSHDSLHRQVLKSVIPSIIQARSSYGHFRTASQMHKVPGIHWPSESGLAAALQQEPLRLNPIKLSKPLDRLKTIYSDTVGAILLVTQHYYSDGSSPSQPYITIVGAPLIMPLGHFSAHDPPGIDYSEFWDDSVFAPHVIPISENLHCPLLAAAEGSSRAVKLPGIVDYLADAQPLLFPQGEQLASRLVRPSGNVYRAFLLPEVCDFPLGMAWPTTISFEDFYSSIRALKAGYAHFLTVLTALQPQLTDWLSAVAEDPTCFVSPSLPFLDIHPRGYPLFDTGGLPSAILDSRAFSPLLEMLQGFLWRLISDSVLTTGTKEAQKVFATFLERGETAITADSYLGAVIPGRLCPNFAYHFAVVARWPTRLNPLAEIILPPLVSERALDYEPLIVDLYTDHPQMLRLLTRDALSTEDHRRQTPRHSYVPNPAEAEALPPPVVTDPPEITRRSPYQYPPASITDQYPPASVGNTPSRGQHLFGSPAPAPAAEHPPLGPPTPAQLYSPPALKPPGPSPSHTPHPPRILGPAFATSLGAQPVPLRRSDPLSATILTAQSRSEASPEFLNCCRLLTHHDPNMAFIDIQLGIPLERTANLFPRQPTEHFRRDVLGPLHTSATSTGYLPVFYNYAEALLSRRGILIESAYSKSFFTASRARNLLSVESWAMSAQTRDLLHLPEPMLHVYSFLQCLLEFQTHPTLLPATGITLLQAKNVGCMVQLLFRMIDMKPDFQTSTFDTSLLGHRLLQWSNLPDSAAIHHIWKENPRLLTFLWFSTLREALAIMHTWIKAQRFHSSLGFYSATNAVLGGQCLLLADSFPSHIPGHTTTLVAAFAKYDLQFTARWYDAALSPYDQTWKALPPPDHFVNAPAPIPAPAVLSEQSRDSSSRRDRDTTTKRLKTAHVRTTKPPADFVCGSHLFEPVVPLPNGKPAITTIMARLKKGCRFPQIPNANGTFDYVCFHSAFPPPHNRCTTSKCKNYYVTPPETRLHVDPSIEPFKSCTEEFWQPIVAFLQLPDVAEHFKPSAALIALTPSTRWA
jgi:hypothetical protein